MWTCGQSGHGQESSLDVWKKKCPAFSKKCLKCGTIGHFAIQCRKNSRGGTHGALQDRGSISNTGKVDGYRFFSMRLPTTKPRHKAWDLRKLLYHAMDMFGTGQPGGQESAAIALHHSVHVSLQRGLRAGQCPCPPVAPHPDQYCSARQDQMVVGGIDLVHKLGVTKKELFPITSGIKAAKSEGLRLIGGLLVTS